VVESVSVEVCRLGFEGERGTMIREREKEGTVRWREKNREMERLK
jgi:hypothetical protein